MKQQQQMINCTITGIGILWADPCFCTEEARTTLENNYFQFKNEILKENKL